MITLMLATVFGQDKVGAVLARYEAAMRAMPCFEVKSVYTNLAKIQVSGDVVIDHNARLWYHGKAKGGDYILSIDPVNGYREVDVYNHMYDQHSYRGDAEIGESRLNGMYKSIPGWLRVQRLQNMIPKAVKYTYLGQAQAANGVAGCDHLNAVMKDKLGTATVDIFVMPNGLVAQYSNHVESPMGNSAASWTLSNYRGSRSFSASKFANPVPDRFVPYALDQTAGPISIENKLSLGPWVDSRTGRSWSAAAKKPQLILITSQDSPPSDRAVTAAKGWRSSLSASGVQLVVVSDAVKASDAKGLLFDPTQKNIKQIMPMSTPLFALVDSSGKVRNLWLGLEPGGSEKLLADIRKAAAGL